MAEQPLSLTDGMEEIGQEERQAPHRPEGTTVPMPEPNIEALVQTEIAKARAEWAKEFQQTQHALQVEQARWQDVRRAMDGTKDDVDPDTAFFRSPTAQLRALREDVTRELRAEYQADQRRMQFWRGFYDENPELEGLEEFVNVAMARHPELGEMSVSAGSAALAQKTREMVLQATQKVRRASSGGEAQFERSGRRRGRQEEPEEQPTSLTAELKLLKGGREAS